MSDNHPDYLGHHYETPEQQFSAGKLGMWLFLATEVLLFGGLFVAYAVYRSSHPEVFTYASEFLDVKMGGINTLVLISSSFTMAMAVRMAQLGRQRATAILLGVTLLGGLGFLGIKKVEYEHKWKHGLLWGTHYQSQESHGTEHEADPSGPANHASDPGNESGDSSIELRSPGSELATGNSEGAGAVSGVQHPVPAEQPQGLAKRPGDDGAPETAREAPKNVHIFFGIYFLMTGLHGVHVIAGMIAIGWVLIRSLRGDFSTAYSTPVDLVGLYWHLVDLIWIFLFPLLYLIR